MQLPISSPESLAAREDDAARFDVANRLFLRLYQSSNLLHKTGTRAVSAFGATTQQWAVMGALARPGSRDSGLTVKELIACGAAGCFLEDQVWPKRCGHMRGKQVIHTDAYLQKIRAAVEARGEHDFFIVARTDALAVEGLESALQRITAAREAGANASFIEAPDSLDTLRAIGQRSPGPNVANMIEGGKTPLLEQQELKSLGFSLILHPLSGLYAAARALEQTFTQLLHQGSSRGLEDRMMTFGEFNSLVDLDAKYAMEERFAVSDAQSNHRERENS